MTLSLLPKIVLKIAAKVAILLLVFAELSLSQNVPASQTASNAASALPNALPNTSKSSLPWAVKSAKALPGYILGAKKYRIKSINSKALSEGFIEFEKLGSFVRELDFTPEEEAKSEEAQKPDLSFEGEVQFRAYLGCNRIFGSVILSQDSVLFGQAAATKMACMDSYEDLFLALISSKLGLAKGENGQLFLLDEKNYIELEEIYEK